LIIVRVIGGIEKEGIMIRPSLVWGTASIMIAVLGYWSLSSAAKDRTAKTGIPPEIVADYVHAIIEADRTLYTTDVVERMQQKGIVVASENWEQHNTLPLPAQFLAKAARLAAEKSPGVHYRLLSFWPIRERNRPASAFERTGLEAVLMQPDRPFTEVVERGGKLYFLAMYADRAVSQACIGCHNAHPDSPKRDFKINDVMGGMLITVPMEQ
jgi:hypothetical protein